MSSIRAFLRSFRQVPFLPCWLAEHGYPRLAANGFMQLWGGAVGTALGVATRTGVLRRGQQVFIPAATFMSVLLRPGDVVADVGAFDGLESLVAAHVVGRSGRVAAFEPNPAAFRRLTTLIRGYGLRQIHAENAAVGATEGTAVLYVPDYSSGATLSANAAVSEGALAQSCRVLSLDQFWKRQGWPPPALIKIDVEGAELDVLEGARAMLTSARPPLVVFEASELNAETFGRSVDDVIRYLKALAYDTWMIRYPHSVRVDEVSQTNLTGAGDFWTDLLAVHPRTDPSRIAALHRQFPTRA